MDNKKIAIGISGVVAIAVVWGLYYMNRPDPKKPIPIPTSAPSLASWLKDHHYTPVEPFTDDLGPGSVFKVGTDDMTLAMSAADLKTLAPLPLGSPQDMTFGYDQSDQNKLGVNPLPDDLTNAIEQSQGAKALIVMHGLAIRRYSLEQLREAILTSQILQLVASDPSICVVNEGVEVSGLQITVQNASGGDVTSNVFKRLTGNSNYKLTSSSSLIISQPVYIGFKLVKLDAALLWSGNVSSATTTTTGGSPTTGTGSPDSGKTAGGGPTATTGATGTGENGGTNGGGAAPHMDLQVKHVMTIRDPITLKSGDMVVRPSTYHKMDMAGDKVILGTTAGANHAMVAVAKGDGTYKVVAPLRQAVNVQFQEVPMRAHLKLVPQKP